MKKADIKNGIIANVIEVDPDNVPDWAKDWPTVTVEGPGWLYDGKKFIAPVPTAQEIDAEMAQARAAVNAERDRRLGTTFTFAGKSYDCDTASLARITGAATLAGFAMGAGAQAGNLRWHGGAADFMWIAADNTLTTMDAQTCFAFGNAAATNQSAHIFAGKAIKAMDPIPADYTDDKYWP